MNTINNDPSTNDEKEVHSEENKSAKTPSAKDRVMEDGKLTFWEILYISRHFLPVLTTIGWIVGLSVVPDDGTFLDILSVSFIVIGLISAKLYISIIKEIFKKTITTR